MSSLKIGVCGLGTVGMAFHTLANEIETMSMQTDIKLGPMVAWSTCEMDRSCQELLDVRKARHSFVDVLDRLHEADRLRLEAMVHDKLQDAEVAKMMLKDENVNKHTYKKMMWGYESELVDSLCADLETVEFKVFRIAAIMIESAR